MDKDRVGIIIQIIALSLLILAPNGYLVWISLWFLGCQLRLWHLNEENQRFRDLLHVYKSHLLELKVILKHLIDDHISD